MTDLSVKLSPAASLPRPRVAGPMISHMMGSWLLHRFGIYGL